MRCRSLGICNNIGRRCAVPSAKARARQDPQPVLRAQGTGLIFTPIHYNVARIDVTVAIDMLGRAGTSWTHMAFIRNGGVAQLSFPHVNVACGRRAARENVLQVRPLADDTVGIPTLTTVKIRQVVFTFKQTRMAPACRC